MSRAVLRVSCQDRPGVVADVARLLFRLGANIGHADQHRDAEFDTFFQRLEFTLPEDAPAAGAQSGPADAERRSATRARAGACAGRCAGRTGCEATLPFRLDAELPPHHRRPGFYVAEPGSANN